MLNCMYHAVIPIGSYNYEYLMSSTPDTDLLSYLVKISKYIEFFFALDRAHPDVRNGIDSQVPLAFFCMFYFRKFHGNLRTNFFFSMNR